MKESKQIVTPMPTKSNASVKKVTRTKAKTRTRVTTTKLKRPAKSVLTLNHYVRDYQSRVKIHNYEFQQFLNDCKKGIQLVRQSSENVYKYALESYKTHFNV
jgi:hypothetical protein